MHHKHMKSILRKLNWFIYNLLVTEHSVKVETKATMKYNLKNKTSLDIIKMDAKLALIEDLDSRGFIVWSYANKKGKRIITASISTI